MRITTFLKPFSFLPAILLMYMIFTFSGQTGDVSSSVSYRASYMIVKTADYVFDVGLDEWQIADYATRINGITRKLAHMTEYFLLAIAVSFPLYVYGVRGILLVLLAGTICIGFACGDEYHQSFIIGRSPSSKDVMIDSFGVLVGIILVRIIGWTGRHTIFRGSGDRAYRNMTKREIKKLKKQQQRMDQEMRLHQEQEMRRRQEQELQWRQEQETRRRQEQDVQWRQNQEMRRRQQPGRQDRRFRDEPYNLDDPYEYGEPGSREDTYRDYPYRDEAYRDETYRDKAYRDKAYRDETYDRGGSYRGESYDRGGSYRGESYDRSGSYRGESSRDNFYRQRDPYEPYEPENPDFDEESSDELSEDMPLSGLFKPRQ